MHEDTFYQVVFYLDDIRDPRNPNGLTGKAQQQARVDSARKAFVIARNLEEAKRTILAYDPFPQWSLDHDLGGDETGMDFLKWVVDNALGKWPRGAVTVHSANPVGAQNMRDFITQVERELLPPPREEPLSAFELKVRTIPGEFGKSPRHVTEIHRGKEGPFILGGYPAELEETHCPYHGRGPHIVGYNQGGHDAIAFCLRCCAEFLESGVLPS